MQGCDKLPRMGRFKTLFRWLAEQAFQWTITSLWAAVGIGSLVTIGIGIWSYLVGLSGPIIILVSLVCGALVTVIIASCAGLYRVRGFAIVAWYHRHKGCGLCWVFENFILNCGKIGEIEHVSNFSIRAKNKSSKFMKILDSYIKSNKSGEKIQINIAAIDGYVPISQINDVPPESIIYGVAEFFDRKKFDNGQNILPGMKKDEFIMHWSDFVFVFSYQLQELKFGKAGAVKTYTRRFTVDFVREQINYLVPVTQPHVSMRSS